MAKQPSEERLKEFSCRIAQEIFKGVLPEAYENFDTIRRRCFPMTLDDITLAPIDPTLLLAAHFLILIYEAVKVHRHKLVLLQDNPEPAMEWLVDDVRKAGQKAGTEKAQLEALCTELSKILSSRPMAALRALLE